MLTKEGLALTRLWDYGCVDGMEGTLKEMTSLGEEVSAELGSGNTEWSVHFGRTLRCPLSVKWRQ